MEFFLNKVISAKQDYAARMTFKIVTLNKNDEGV
jgi:hypothetical protein